MHLVPSYSVPKLMPVSEVTTGRQQKPEPSLLAPTRRGPDEGVFRTLPVTSREPVRHQQTFGRKQLASEWSGKGGETNSMDAEQR